MKTLDKIQVGDTVVISNRHGDSITKVSNVTSAHFIASNIKFRKINGYEVGGDRWCMTNAYIPTAEQLSEIRAVNRRSNIISEIKGMKWDSLTSEKLERIAAILDE